MDFAYAGKHEKQAKAYSLLSAFETFETTKDIPIPKEPMRQVIGQDEAVKISAVAAKQRRHLLLVGPPGTGKSLIAQAVSFHLPKPTQEVSVLHNPETPERPIIEVRTDTDIEKEKRALKDMKGRVVQPADVPSFVSERLGFRCRKCGALSQSRQAACPGCGADKFARSRHASPFSDLIDERFFDEVVRQDRVHTTKLDETGREEVVVYERQGEAINVLDQKSLERMDALKRKTPRKVIVPIPRNTFISATGASETELLGDVRHDPYGGHSGLGTAPYLRVVAGAAHEAHEGVLFIDEISALAHIQRYLLTAMQEKKYSIVGRNPQSAGASVKVEGVPCDFVLIAASNINDIQHILPPLRSRILGNGYEVLLETTMPDTPLNRALVTQFVAQEIRKDGRIPPASRDAVEALIAESRRRAVAADHADNALTLRLRDLSGIIRLAGDVADGEGKEVIDAALVELAIKRGRNIEEQLKARYGSLYKASLGDAGTDTKGEGREVG